jgi:hypothetical protein
LKDIYSSVQKVIDNNYPEETLPRWVNKKLFNDDMLRNFMNNFIGEFVNQIIDIYVENEREPFPEINKIDLFKPLVATVLYSNNVEFLDEFECIQTDIPNTITIPKSFYQYIIHTVNKLAKYTKYEYDKYTKYEYDKYTKYEYDSGNDNFDDQNDYDGYNDNFDDQNDYDGYNDDDRNGYYQLDYNILLKALSDMLFIKY